MPEKTDKLILTIDSGYRYAVRHSCQSTYEIDQICLYSIGNFSLLVNIYPFTLVKLINICQRYVWYINRLFFA